MKGRDQRQEAAHKLDMRTPNLVCELPEIWHTLTQENNYHSASDYRSNELLLRAQKAIN